MTGHSASAVAAVAAEPERGRIAEARCLSGVMTAVRENGWTHDNPRLVVPGNFAMQRGSCAPRCAAGRERGGKSCISVTAKDALAVWQ